MIRSLPQKRDDIYLDAQLRTAESRHNQTGVRGPMVAEMLEPHLAYAGRISPVDQVRGHSYNITPPRTRGRKHPTNVRIHLPRLRNGISRAHYVPLSVATDLAREVQCVTRANGGDITRRPMHVLGLNNRADGSIQQCTSVMCLMADCVVLRR